MTSAPVCVPQASLHSGSQGLSVDGLYRSRLHVVLAGHSALALLLCPGMAEAFAQRPPHVVLECVQLDQCRLGYKVPTRAFDLLQQIGAHRDHGRVELANPIPAQLQSVPDPEACEESQCAEQAGAQARAEARRELFHVGYQILLSLALGAAGGWMGSAFASGSRKY